MLPNPGAVDSGFAVDKPGSYVIQLVVNDGTLDSLPATAMISTANSRPVAAAGPDHTGWVGQSAVFDGSQSFDTDQDWVGHFPRLVRKQSGEGRKEKQPGQSRPIPSERRVATFLSRLGR